MQFGGVQCPGKGEISVYSESMLTPPLRGGDTAGKPESSSRGGEGDLEASHSWYPVVRMGEAGAVPKEGRGGILAGTSRCSGRPS